MNTFLASLIVLALAGLSWRFVEKPALTFKLHKQAPSP